MKIKKNLLLNTLELIISIFAIISSLLIYNEFQFILFYFILFYFKYLKKAFLFTPEYFWNISYLLFFILPYYFYSDGIFLGSMKYYNVLQIVSILYYILNISSIIFFVKFKKFFHQDFDYFKSLISSISIKKLILFSTFIIVMRISFYIADYKRTAISSLNQSSVIDIVFIPIFYTSSFLLFILLFIIFIGQKKKLILYIQVIVIILLDLLYLSKGRILLDLFLIIFIYYLKNKKLPWFYLTLFAILMFIYIPIAQFERFSNAGTYTGNLFELLIFSFSNFNFFISLILGRTNMIEPLARAIDNLDTIQNFLTTFSLNNTFFPFLFQALVPRFLVPDRQDSSIGGEMGYLLGYTSDPSVTQVTISLFGEFYINFLWFSTIFILIYGIFYNYLYYKLIKLHSMLFFLGIYFLFFNVFTGFESYFVVRNAIFIKTIIIYIFVYYLLKQRRIRI